jgi:hypothetical protein
MVPYFCPWTLQHDLIWRKYAKKLKTRSGSTRLCFHRLLFAYRPQEVPTTICEQYQATLRSRPAPQVQRAHAGGVRLQLA